MYGQFQPSSVLTSRAATVGELLSGSARLEPAGFQRAYAWQVEQAMRLLDGIIETEAKARAEDGLERHRSARDAWPSWYNLGTFTLTPTSRGKVLLVADGQQRLVTLTILFALLRDLAGKTPEPSSCHDRVLLSLPGEAPRPRYNPQRDVRDTFMTYVQSPLGSLEAVPEDEREEMSVSENNVIENRDALREALEPLTPAARARIASFLDNRCVVIVNEVANEDDAREIFRVTHTTGLQLSSGDVFKADVLSCVPRAERSATARVWEEWQIKLGPDRMHRLFEVIRAVKLRKPRHGHDLYEDLIDAFQIEKAAVGFVRDEFVPMATIYGSILDGTVGGPDKAGEEIRRRLRFLKWVPHREWMAPVFHLLRSSRHSAEEVMAILRRLDRLAYMLFICTEQAPKRQSRYSAVIAQIDARRALAPVGALALSSAELKRMRSALLDRRLKPRLTRVHILRRVNAALDGGNGPHLDTVATIEHVLPRNPEPGSKWVRGGASAADRAATLEMLGNLTMLAQKENGAAENAEFEVKRPILSRSVFALSVEASERPGWSPEVIRERTEWLVRRLDESWED